jgi:hypothetical protein
MSPLATQQQASSASPISELDQLVDGRRLLFILFPDGHSRPSIKWLRHQVHSRQIPYIKRGRKVWYTPRTVKAWFDLKEVKPLRMQ